MRHLALVDLRLGLTDLLTKRRAALELTAIGARYAPMLQKKLDQINALPAALIGKALAQELDEADMTHDGFGGAVWLQTESYVRAPGTAAAVVEAAQRIRGRFIPAMSALNASYADQADAALERKKVLEANRADLESFPLAGNKTLFDWVQGFLDAGEQIHTLLSNRADASEGKRKEAGALRSSTLGMLSRLRAGIADEVADDAALPRDLDAQVFGYVDELHAPRAAAKARQGKKGEGAPEDGGSGEGQDKA